MSLREWWKAVKDVFGKPANEPVPDERRFLPPHSLPDSELPPKWPKRKKGKK